MYAPFETGQLAPQSDVYRQRDARRAVHEPVPAGPGARPGRPLARGLPDVRRGQPAVRRHRQGDADVEGRRRHGPVHGRQQSDAGGRARAARASWRFPSRWSSSSRAGWASRRAASRRSCRSASCAAGKPITGRPGASLPPADFAAAAGDLEKQTRPARSSDRELVTLSALSARVSRLRRAPGAVFRHQRAADAGVLPRHGAGRGSRASTSSRARR